jgi:hypothetical protein
MHLVHENEIDLLLIFGFFVAGSLLISQCRCAVKMFVRTRTIGVLSDPTFTMLNLSSQLPLYNHDCLKITS